MKEMLITHAPILKEIPRLISEKYGIRSDSIKLGNISTIDENVMNFQLSFKHVVGGLSDEIVLDFELKENTPHLLYFETLTGLKGFQRSNEYHGLEHEIIKFISIKMEL